MDNPVKVTFDDKVKKDVLDLLNKDVDGDGFIVEKDNPTQRVLTVEGEEITLEELGGVQKGSEVFIKKDVVSLMRISKG
jgi:hypothetical protein